MNKLDSFVLRLLTKTSQIIDLSALNKVVVSDDSSEGNTKF